MISVGTSLRLWFLLDYRTYIYCLAKIQLNLYAMLSFLVITIWSLMQKIKGSQKTGPSRTTKHHINTQVLTINFVALIYLCILDAYVLGSCLQVTMRWSECEVDSWTGAVSAAMRTLWGTITVERKMSLASKFSIYQSNHRLRSRALACIAVTSGVAGLTLNVGRFS